MLGISQSMEVTENGSGKDKYWLCAIRRGDKGRMCSAVEQQGGENLRCRLMGCFKATICPCRDKKKGGSRELWLLESLSMKKSGKMTGKSGKKKNIGIKTRGKFNSCFHDVHVFAPVWRQFSPDRCCLGRCEGNSAGHWDRRMQHEERQFFGGGFVWIKENRRERTKKRRNRW